MSTPQPPEPILIEDAADPRLAPYRNLRDRDHRREGLFLAESVLVVEALLKQPGLATSVLCTPQRLPQVQALLGATPSPQSAQLFVLEEARFEELAGFDFHRGVMAVGRRDRLGVATLEDLVPRGGQVLLVTEGLSNIDNIGMLFRSATAFGATGILMDERCHDPLYRKTLRVGVGSALHLPYRRSDHLPTDLDALREQHGVSSAALVIDEDAMPLDAAPLDEPVALVVGHEGQGVSRAVAQRVDWKLRIPMVPGFDSLNVVVATSIALHRLARQGRI